MNEYTPEMLVKLELCKGCNKFYYFDTELKTCINCRERRIKPKDVVLCSKNGCKFKRSKENIYCGKHQLCLFEDEVKFENKKVCLNLIRGCRSKLELDYKFSRCEECLEKDREKDRNRRGKVKEENTSIALDSKCCSSCCKEFPLEQFIGERHTAITKTCKKCREIGKICDNKRDKEHRNEVARKNDAKPENKAVKSKWKEENYEKVAKIWMDSRERQLENLGTEEYLKKQAENAKKWRENNPEKQEIVNENKKHSKKLQYNIYSRNAGVKNLEFTISYDDYVAIVEKSCYYCGILQEKGFNGIDRKDQTKGYILENCVSCCKLCNYMKGSTSNEVFIKRAEHILTFQNKISGNLYSECFANHKSACYSSYKSRALKKQLDFLITNEDYDKIINNNCYLCGKTNDDKHKNGIDRIDNSKGYFINNVKSCCGECNYMKNDYELDDIINKLLLIYKNHKDDDTENEYYNYDKTNTLKNSIIYTNNVPENTSGTIEEISNENTVTKQQVYREKMIKEYGIDYVREKQKEKMRRLRSENKNIVKNENKKTNDEIKEAARLRKQKQRETLKEKYGDEEYKKIRAKEIAENRRKKKGEP
uniref:Uncharacterized protein n=1 Tax=viral metagenome TaxID=1070528 RepID=A0A6C0I5H7_9ZZZZ